MNKLRNALVAVIVLTVSDSTLCSTKEANPLQARLDAATRAEDGVGEPVNLQKTKRILETAYEKGSSEAPWRLCTIYFGTSQRHGSTEETNGVLWCQRAAGRGNCEAQYYLGELYFEGRIVQRSLENAFSWFLKAANQGDERACVRVADMYWLGRGTTADAQRALTYYQKAANKGHTESMSRLAAIYDKGIRVPKNLEKAAMWRRRFNLLNGVEGRDMESVVKSLEIK